MDEENGMKRRRLISLGFLITSALICVQLAFAQFGAGSANVVKAQGYASASKIIAPGKFDIAIQLTVGEGYHINAHYPSEDYECQI
jgi:hypothetical protein